MHVKARDPTKMEMRFRYSVLGDVELKIEYTYIIEW